jgi:hypothetical protein
MRPIASEKTFCRPWRQTALRLAEQSDGKPGW